MKVLLLALVLCLAGCAQQDLALLPLNATLAVSADFTQDELAGIVAAADEWAAAVPAIALQIEVSDRALARWTVVKQADVPEGGGACTYRPDTIGIKLEPIAVLGAEHFRLLVVHELGHALGVHGHRERGIMMGQPVDPRSCIDSHTLAEFCLARPEACDGSERPTCGEL